MGLQRDRHAGLAAAAAAAPCLLTAPRSSPTFVHAPGGRPAAAMVLRAAALCTLLLTVRVLGAKPDGLGQFGERGAAAWWLAAGDTPLRPLRSRPAPSAAPAAACQMSVAHRKLIASQRRSAPADAGELDPGLDGLPGGRSRVAHIVPLHSDAGSLLGAAAVAWQPDPGLDALRGGEAGLLTAAGEDEAPHKAVSFGKRGRGYECWMAGAAACSCRSPRMHKRMCWARCAARHLTALPPLCGLPQVLRTQPRGMAARLLRQQGRTQRQGQPQQAQRRRLRLLRAACLPSARP